MDPFLNMPVWFHQAWRRVVAATACWAPEMEENEPLNVRPITGPLFKKNKKTNKLSLLVNYMFCRSALLVVLTCADVCWHVQILRGLLQRGPTPGMLTLQGAVRGGQ